MKETMPAFDEPIDMYWNHAKKCWEAFDMTKITSKNDAQEFRFWFPYQVILGFLIQIMLVVGSVWAVMTYQSELIWFAKETWFIARWAAAMVYMYFFGA